MKNPFKSLISFLKSGENENIFRLDGAVPLAKAVPLGLQHVLAMFVGNVAPILICFALVNASAEVTNNAIRAAILMAAIGTTIQLYPFWKFGARLPVVVGTSFTFLGVLSLIGAKNGLGTMFLSIIVGGPIIAVLGLFADKWKRFIKPIVSAVVVLGVGLSLLSVGIEDFLSLSDSSLNLVADGVYQFDKAWPYLLVSSVTLIAGLLWQIFVKGVWKNISILVGLVAGYLLALCFIPYNNMVDFSGMAIRGVGDIINVPMPYFVLVPASWSDFNIGSILSVLLIYIVVMTESIGGVSSLAATGLNREVEGKELSGCIAGIGLTGALAGFFGAMPYSIFTQNVGIVGQTKVVNRFVVFQGALLLFVASFFPPVSALLMTIPKAVLGGTMLMLFASIVVIGMQMIAKIGFTKKTVMIASLAIGLGYGITLVPSFTAGNYDVEFLNYLMLILQNPVANMFIIALILSYAIPDKIDEEKPKNPVKP